MLMLQNQTGMIEVRCLVHSDFLSDWSVQIFPDFRFFIFPPASNFLDMLTLYPKSSNFSEMRTDYKSLLSSLKVKQTTSDIHEKTPIHFQIPNLCEYQIPVFTSTATFSADPCVYTPQSCKSCQAWMIKTRVLLTSPHKLRRGSKIS